MRIHPFRHLVFAFIFLTHWEAGSQVTFVIDWIPRATPAGDSIFITGTFNNWSVGDSSSVLKKLPNGHYSITLPIDSGTIEYKFTRGSWMKIETDDQNQYLPNRVMKVTGNVTIPIRIENWQDLGGAQDLPIVVFYFFAVGFQALLLIVLAGRITKRDPVRYQLLVLLNVILALFFAGEIWYSISNLSIHAFLILLGQFAFFLWGPGVLLFLTLYNKERVNSFLPLLALPAIVTLVFFSLKMVSYPLVGFLSVSINNSLSFGNALFAGTGIVFNLGIFLYCGYHFGFRLFHFFSLEPEDRFPDLFIKLQVLAVVTAALNLIILYIGNSSVFLVDFHLVPLALSLIVFTEMYYLWRFPAIIKEKSRFVVEADDAENLKERLNKLMKEHKPYTDPNLSLQRLSELLETKPHILSRVLNDHFRQNFRDFVNHYRIDEFIRQADEEHKLQTFTYLALAMDVGFNSKSTFNLAFKKVTGKSPREYFKNLQY